MKLVIQDDVIYWEEDPYLYITPNRSSDHKMFEYDFVRVLEKTANQNTVGIIYKVGDIGVRTCTRMFL